MRRFVEIAMAWMWGTVLLIGMLSWMGGHRSSYAQPLSSTEAEWRHTGVLPLPSLLKSARMIPTDCVLITQDVTISTTWTAPCYRIEKNQVTVLETATLTIDPAVGGTWIVFTEDAQLDVKGRLQALGTVERPITFTSGSPLPARGDWMGINFGTNSTRNRLQYAIIEYASTAIAPSACTSQGDGDWILSNTLRYNGGDGQMNGAIGGDIDYSEIRYNTIYSCSQGIVLNEASHTQISDNTIYDIDLSGISLMKGGLGGGSYITIANNHIFRCREEGLLLEVGNNNRVLSNTITHCQGSGIVLARQFSTTARYNLIYTNAQSSRVQAAVIITDGSANIDFSQNQVAGNGADSGSYIASVYVYGMSHSFNQLLFKDNIR